MLRVQFGDLRVQFGDGCLWIEDDEERLTSLTIYHGCPSVTFHYVTKENIKSIITSLEKILEEKWENL